MRIRTDDDIYRVDSVWLGPPRATFPWRATYASYLVGFLIFIFVLFVQRRIGIAFNILPTAWALVITVFATRLISRKVNYEKGVLHLFQHFWWEVVGPRAKRARLGHDLRTGHVRVSEQLPRMRRSRSSTRARPAASVRARAAVGSRARAAVGARAGTTGGSAGRARARSGAVRAEASLRAEASRSRSETQRSEAARSRASRSEAARSRAARSEAARSSEASRTEAARSRASRSEAQRSGVESQVRSRAGAAAGSRARPAAAARTRGGAAVQDGPETDGRAEPRSGRSTRSSEQERTTRSATRIGASRGRR